MGMLAAISAAVQTARLNAAVTNLGVQNELDVIAAAVIGGTSFSGGIGTIPGAVLGAVVMQSLRSGMVMLSVDSPTQDIVVGVGAGRGRRPRFVPAREVRAMSVDATHDRPSGAPTPTPTTKGTPLVEMRDIRWPSAASTPSTT